MPYPSNAEQAIAYIQGVVQKVLREQPLPNCEETRNKIQEIILDNVGMRNATPTVLTPAKVKIVHDLRGPKHKRKTYVLVDGEPKCMIKGRPWRKVKHFAKEQSTRVWYNVTFQPVQPVQRIELKFKMDPDASR